MMGVERREGIAEILVGDRVDCRAVKFFSCHSLRDRVFRIQSMRFEFKIIPAGAIVDIRGITVRGEVVFTDKIQEVGPEQVGRPERSIILLAGKICALAAMILGEVWGKTKDRKSDMTSLNDIIDQVI